MEYVMDTLDANYFLKQLEYWEYIDETNFYFIDDPNEYDHYLGCIPEYEKPYWIGYCDVPDGCEFFTAEELVNAKVFDGKSLKERWDKVRFVNIYGICLDDWIKNFPQV